MRVTSCPDCGEVVEIPEKAGSLEEVTCPTCGLSGPADEWRSYAPEDDDSLLGRPLADATIPATVPRNWAIRIEQLEEIKDVVVELQHQIRLLRQALDELNEDLPDRVKRWIGSLQDARQPLANLDVLPVTEGKSTTSPVKHRPSAQGLNAQASLW
jgi:hypothetical protein